RSVGLAMRESLPLRVLTAFDDLPGTEIVPELGDNDMERNAIAGIAADRNEGRITLTGIADRPGMVAAVMQAKKDDVRFDEIHTDDAVAKVSIVGVGIRSNPELAAKMFATLAERGINLLAVSASEIKVSVLVKEDEMELAVRVLHSAFGLDAPRGEE